MRVLVERAADLGLDGEVMRALRGPEEWDALEVPERIRRGDALWATALRTSPDPAALPARLARLYEPDDLGALGLAMRSADTLGEALERLSRYHVLFLPAPIWRFEQDKEALVARCVWDPPLLPLHVQVSVEFLSVLLAHLAERVCGRPVPVLELCFRHPARGPTTALQEALGVAPTFNASWSGLRVGREALGWRLDRADRTLSSFLLGELEALEARSDAGDARLLLERLRVTIRARLPDGPPPMTEAARRLGLSERTLRRRLGALGTTWEQLVDATREAAARELVRGSSYSLAEISYLLGFSEPSAFHRAFRRWTGQTPASFRDAEA